MSSRDQDLRPGLPVRTKLAFGMGSFAEAIALFSVGIFSMIFYNQVLGLPAYLAGLAGALSLVLDGVSDPIIGSISDRTRTRLGRRHPYMFAAPLPIALSIVAVFNPPAGLSETGLFIWFAVSVIFLRQSMTLFHTPHFAMGGELSTDYTERSKVMSYASFFTSIGAGTLSFIGFTFFFGATEEYPKGVLNPQPWFAFSVTMATAALIGLYASAWFTRDRIRFLPQPPANQGKTTALELLRDIGKAFSNRNYSLLLVGYFLLTMTVGLRYGLQVYTSTYFWQLASSDLRWIMLGSLYGIGIAFLLTARLHVLFDKKSVIVGASVVQAVAPSIPIALGLYGVLTPASPYLVPVLTVFQTIGFAGFGMLTISVTSAMADIADENEVRYGVRQEGVMYAMRHFFGKVDQAVGAFLAGVVLTLIAFPRQADVEAVPTAILHRLAFCDGILAAIPGLLAVVPYLFYRIDKRSYERTRAVLDARRGDAGAV